MRKVSWMVVAGGLALAACSVEKDKGAAADGTDTAGVTRQEASPPPTAATPPSPPAAPAAAPIQTQPGPEGRSVDLLRASVAGDVLSVALTYRAATGTRSNGKSWHNSSHFRIDEVSAIDDATAKRLGVLKDDRGQWMAAPLSTAQPDEINVEAGDEDVQVWFKFPAPSPETKTVSINIPKAGTFDAVPVRR